MSNSNPLLTPAPPQGWPVWRLGFRPFYLGAALFACLSVLLWVSVFLGQVDLAVGIAPTLWHAHEMLFGFATAVIVGFLLTAVKAWTGLPTPRGWALGGLFALWLAARLAVFVAPYSVYASLDMALLPLVAIALLRVLVKAGNKRNIPFISLLLLMTVANGVFHLAARGVVQINAMSALYAQLGLIVMVVGVMGGRVIPAFTRSVNPGLNNTVSRRFEMAVLAITALAWMAWVLAVPAWLVASLSVVAAVMHALRLWQWRPMAARQRPILWILHVSYAWTPLGFGLLASAQMGWVAPSLAVHAFGVGLIGGLIIGMITRTARGHTGRQLIPTRGEVWAYGLVMAAAVLRVAVPAVRPEWLVFALHSASGLWALAFAIYLWIYTPWLTRSRIDGKDG